MFWMYDTRGRGDSGGMSCALWEDENGTVVFEDDARPRVGVAMRVGSRYARTMQSQDWWQTTYITEILEESENRVLFKTKNSVYEWREI